MLRSHYRGSVQTGTHDPGGVPGVGSWPRADTSRRAAHFVAEFLEDNGVDTDIGQSGMGEEIPITGNETEEGCLENR